MNAKFDRWTNAEWLEKLAPDTTSARFNEQEDITRRYVSGEISPEVFFAWVRADSSASLSEDEARWIGRQRAKDLQDDDNRTRRRRDIRGMLRSVDYYRSKPHKAAEDIIRLIEFLDAEDARP